MGFFDKILLSPTGVWLLVCLLLALTIVAAYGIMILLLWSIGTVLLMLQKLGLLHESQATEEIAEQMLNATRSV